MLRDMQGKSFELRASSLPELNYKLRNLIHGMANSAKADIEVMAAQAKGKPLKFSRGLRLA